VLYINSVPVRILFVEDSKTDLELLLRALQQGGFRPEWRNEYQLEALREALTQFEPDIIRSDFSMPELTGLEVLKLARELRPDLRSTSLAVTANYYARRTQRRFP
jgi:CheY-like chemotaxis protein